MPEVRIKDVSQLSAEERARFNQFQIALQELMRDYHVIVPAVDGQSQAYPFRGAVNDAALLLLGYRIVK